VRSYDDNEGGGRFTSIDPMWEDYRAYSPYNYCGNNPVKLSDPDGKAWPLVVYAILEAAATVTDIIDAGTTIMNPNSTGLDITLSIAGVGAGILAPGGGYGVGAKGVVKAVSKADDVVDGAKAIGKVAEKVAEKAEKVAEKGKVFTQSQKREIFESNKLKNEGVLRSDKSGIDLVASKKSTKGVTPPNNEAQVDHIVPRSKGGTNTRDNAQVLSRKENRTKSNNPD